MQFRIADTFTDSLAKLTGEEQKAVKTTAFDLQLNPANPGLSFHKLDGVRDKRFWSVRVNADIRLIVHRSESSLLLCYVDHHDKAYQWAERRKLETHPKTGAAQLVEIRETVQEITVPVYVDAEPPSPAKLKLFEHVAEDELLGYGVPPEWLSDVRQADEDSLLGLADHLPAEAAEALLELATGGTPQQPVVSSVGDDPFAHPDAQRRFRVMSDVAELEQALEYPWEKWTIFLHPAQRQWVEWSYSGPARVSGSAGTGKTIVALHRAVFLARKHPESRVLLTTFSDTLASALQTKLRRLISNTPRLAERLEVHSMNALGERLYQQQFGTPQLVSTELLERLLKEASNGIEDMPFTQRFLFAEWTEVVDAWQLDSWESYRDIKRLGRKTRLPEARRATLWAIFEKVRAAMDAQGLMTHAGMFSRLAEQIAERQRAPFDFVVIDEAQDVSAMQLRFLAALGAGKSDGLFFAGDLGQRIFQQPFSWKAQGVDVRGRSRTLHVNYRTSHQIRMCADRLLGAEVADVDGNVEDRRGTVSVFNGPSPTLRTFASEQDEIAFVGDWLKGRLREDIQPHEIGLFVRSAEELARARAAIERAGLPYQELDERIGGHSGHLALCTMHLAKGLEFRVVIVMACDDEVLPSMPRIEAVADDADLEEVYATERHLLYVASTRARDELLLTAVEPASEFLEDMFP